LYMVGAILALFSVIPGFPMLTFLILGGAIAYGGYFIERKQKAVIVASERAKMESSTKGAKGDNLEDLLDLDLLELEVGYGLVNLVDQEQNGELLERISHIRKQF